ncbi:E3 ubiquitin-protein ligase RNF115-like [Haliotis cracherodii]|uniref:E3 ubiquitin-protein ligase RNF115-like n=1 Tax=Haliotis rufescens TaxID=6454 RepID=UPI001EAFD00D|nr:E3 ubiquitin-protein ligase RNF115-like [Haliotis rufescens]
MAEAAVESSTSERFYCHQCTQEITPKLPDYTCPRCDGGFIEQMAEESPSHSPAAGELDPAAQFAELWSRAFLDSFRNNTTDRNDSSGPWPQNRDSDEEEPEEAGDSRRPFQVRFAPRTRISFRRGGRPNPSRNPYLEGLVNYFISRLGVDPAGQGGSPIGMFHLHGNPGDYAWGAGGLDHIISQLLNQLEGAGAPPAEKDKIDSLPTVRITKEQAERVLQCSICMEDFQVEEEAKKLPCEHHYHTQCINKWLELHGTCPVCRKDLNGETYKEDFSPSMNSDSSNSSDEFQSLH